MVTRPNMIKPVTNAVSSLSFNTVAADRLREAAALLEHQADNRFRVAAYRRAAETIATLNADVRQLLDAGGIQALQAIPGIGPRFSNTARAHELGKVRDWVVLYFHSDSGGESRRTVVTETHGVLSGKRTVRGREQECMSLYLRTAQP